MIRRSLAVAVAIIAAASASACTINIGVPGSARPTASTSTADSDDSRPSSAPDKGDDAVQSERRKPSKTSTVKKASKVSEVDPLAQLEAEFTPTTQTTDHFAMTVTRVRADAETIGVKVRTCVIALPSGWEGSVRVSPDPWSFLIGSGDTTVRAELDPRFGPVMKEQHLSPGECGTGWLSYDMSRTDPPTGLKYSNSLGEVAYF